MALENSEWPPKEVLFERPFTLTTLVAGAGFEPTTSGL